MSYSIKKYTDKKGKQLHELRIWGRGAGSKQKRIRRETKKELLNYLDTLEASERVQEDLAVKETATFGSEYEYFMANKATTFSPGWQFNLRQFYKNLRGQLETKPVETIDSLFLTKLESEFRQNGNSQKTINLKIGFIQAVLNYSFRKRRVMVNQWVRHDKIKPPEVVRDFWEREDAEDFLRFVNRRYPRASPKRWIYVAYLVALNTGIRAGEVWALRPKCLRDNKQLRIEERLEIIDAKFYLPKGKGPRNTPMNDTLDQELRDLIKAKKAARHELIFQNVRGGSIEHKNFCDDHWKKDLKAWGGPRITFHGLRHTAATLMLDSGVDLRTVQEILGHKDIKTTLRYVHMLAKNVTNAAITGQLRLISKNSLSYLCHQTENRKRIYGSDFVSLSNEKDIIGAAAVTRTRNPQVRSLILYPIELRLHR